MAETNKFQNDENNQNGIPEIKAAVPQENISASADGYNYDVIMQKLTDMNKNGDNGSEAVRLNETAPVTEQPNIPISAAKTAYIAPESEQAAIPVGAEPAAQPTEQKTAEIYSAEEQKTKEPAPQETPLTEIDVNTFNNAKAFDAEQEADAAHTMPDAQPLPDVGIGQPQAQAEGVGSSMPLNGSVPFFGNNYTQPVQQAIPVMTPVNNMSVNNIPVYPQYQTQYPQPRYQTQYQPQYQPAYPQQYYGYQGVSQQIPSPMPMPVTYGAAVPPQKPVKKKNVGAAVYVSCIFLLMAAFITAFVYYGLDKISGGGAADNSGTSSSSGKDDTSSIGGTAASTTEPDEVDTGVNPDGPNVTLEEVAQHGEYSARAAFKKIDPSVVSVLVYENDKEMKNDYTSEGSGVIISKDGYIVTNSHVILNQKNKSGIQVVLWDENVYTATVVGFDTRTDLAVLKIKAGKLIPASFVDSDLLEIGEDVIAVGNPGGIEFSHSLTRGVISAVNRTVSTDNYVKYIQTDTAINPGNSGGPLTNLYGQVVGINTIKIVDEEYEGMGFAIPSRVVKSIIDDLITKGYVQDRVRIGIKGQSIGFIDADRYGLKGGISIMEFTDDSSFAGTAAKKNDIIAYLNDTEIDCFATLYGELEKYKPGDSVKITLYRPSEAKKIDVTIILLADTGQSQN